MECVLTWDDYDERPPSAARASNARGGAATAQRVRAHERAIAPQHAVIAPEQHARAPCGDFDAAVKFSPVTSVGSFCAEEPARTENAIEIRNNALRAEQLRLNVPDNEEEEDRVNLEFFHSLISDETLNADSDLFLREFFEPDAQPRPHSSNAAEKPWQDSSALDRREDLHWLLPSPRPEPPRTAAMPPFATHNAPNTLAEVAAGLDPAFFPHAVGAQHTDYQQQQRFVHASPRREHSSGVDIGLRKTIVKKIARRFKPENRVTSRFCHICLCTETADNRAYACSNVADGVCRKMICHSCLVKDGRDVEQIAANIDRWVCSHCCDACPQGSPCRKWRSSKHT
mmetsp:Transcript_1310/g.3597  ORF Transcript_1310/g.3597 Transcript_1310/m.3597 type:complete len:342 (-) Transcript_1310:23-1048(-)